MESEDQAFGLFTVKSNANSGILVNLSINSTPIAMTLDTGASISIISELTLKTRLPQLQLRKSNILLRTYTGEPLKICGETDVCVKYNDQQCHLQLVVVEGEGPPLFGQNWLQEIKLDWKEISMVSISLESLLQRYHTLFKDELGTMVGVTAKLHIKSDTVPKFCRARAAPYALRDAIEKDINRLQKLGVLEKVQYSDWATPVVPVPKPDGSVRLCGDFKVTLNPMLQVDQHPLPKPEDLLTILVGGKKFSKIDLSQAYQQMILEQDHRKYTTINTHLGLFQYTRLPFGIASAPAIFQQQMEKILQGIPRTACYLDDILITGCDDEEHLNILRKVFDRLHQWGLRLKESKCSFMKSSVKYLGYIVDAEGLHTAPDKIDAITNAPKPKNLHQLRSFLGLVNYYGKFLPSLSTTTHPLNQLMQANRKWK